jgi:hypothetical protein
VLQVLMARISCSRTKSSTTPSVGAAGQQQQPQPTPASLVPVLQLVAAVLMATQGATGCTRLAWAMLRRFGRCLQAPEEVGALSYCHLCCDAADLPPTSQEVTRAATAVILRRAALATLLVHGLSPCYQPVSLQAYRAALSWLFCLQCWL